MENKLKNGEHHHHIIIIYPGDMGRRGFISAALWRVWLVSGLCSVLDFGNWKNAQINGSTLGELCGDRLCRAALGGVLEDWGRRREMCDSESAVAWDIEVLHLLPAASSA